MATVLVVSLGVLVITATVGRLLVILRLVALLVVIWGLSGLAMARRSPVWRLVVGLLLLKGMSVHFQNN